MKDELLKNIDLAADKVIKNFYLQIGKLRTGRANPSILDGIQVDYYGNLAPLKQVAQISIPEARILQLQPFDKGLIGVIEKAILGANIGATPTNDGNFVRIPFPALTEDKRKLIVKDLKKLAEESKISLRNARRDQIEVVKKCEKSKEISEDLSKKLQSDIQVLVDKFIKQIDDISVNKEKELLSV